MLKRSRVRKVQESERRKVIIGVSVGRARDNHAAGRVEGYGDWYVSEWVG